MPFKKGQSGNPNGRPKKPQLTTGEFFKRIKGELPAIIQAQIDKAKEGDSVATRLLLERCYPPIRAEARPVAFTAAGTLTEQAESIVQAIAQGAIPPDTGAYILTALGGLARLKEQDEFERRLAALEEAQEHPGDEIDPT